MGCNCPGSRAKTASIPQQRFIGGRNRMSAMEGTAMATQNIDDSMVLVLYDSPNRGQHKVVGAATGMRYGHHGGGDRFLVHKRDIAAQPNLYRVVDAEIPMPKVVKTQVIKAPKPITTTPIVAEEELGVEEKPIVPEGDLSLPPVSLNDLSTIAGLSPAIEQQLNEMGVFDFQGVYELGKGKLTRLKGVGPSRADAIYTFVQKYIETEKDE